MRQLYAFIAVSIWFTASSFTDKRACDYAGSNLDFVKSQTQLAMKAESPNMSRYFAYKALNAIEKSKTQFEACGCDYAIKSIDEGLNNLKQATKVSSINGTRILLKRALENTMGSIEALENHDELHVSSYASDVLESNTVDAMEEKLRRKMPGDKELHRRIDAALVNFENSLNEVVLSVDCKEAYDFATRIYNHCEQELFKKDLTPAKKYYNFKTKEITANALERLKGCSN